MIILLSAAIALASLVVGIVLEQPIFSYVALGVCILATAVLAADMVKTYRQAHLTGAGNTEDSEGRAVDGSAVARDEHCSEPSGIFIQSDSPEEIHPPMSQEFEEGAAEPDVDSESTDTAWERRDDALVHVIPGRKRYHLGECRLIAGKDSDTVGAVEAQEEGLSPCTVCQPERIPAM